MMQNAPRKLFTARHSAMSDDGSADIISFSKADPLREAKKDARLKKVQKKFKAVVNEKLKNDRKETRKNKSKKNRSSSKKKKR